MVTPAPSTAATTVGTTRARAKTPAPLAPSWLATSIAARAAAPVDRKLVTMVIETLRTSFTVGRPSLGAGPGDQRLAGLPLGPCVVERPVAVVGVERLAHQAERGAAVPPVVTAHRDGGARDPIHAGEADRDELPERPVAEDEVAALGLDRRLLAAGEDGGERLGQGRDAVGQLGRHRDQERGRVPEHALREPVGVARQVEV